MPDVFSSSSGGVLVVPMNKGRPATLSIDGFAGPGSGYQRVRAIVTSLGVSEVAALQLSHALTDSIHYYTFGDRIGELRFSGVLFMSQCDGSNGFSSAYKYWRRNRAGARTTPITVSLGTEFAVRGLLNTMDLVIDNPELSFGRFAFGMRHFPDVTQRQP
jgi:hypothetical protein